MSAFRSLAPSTQQDDSSTPSSSKVTGESTNASSGNNDGGGGNGGGSDRRESDAGADGNANPRKRRTAGSVSQMACSPCRQARQRVRSLALIQHSPRLGLKSLIPLTDTSYLDDNYYLGQANLRSCFFFSVTGKGPTAVVDVLPVT